MSTWHLHNVCMTCSDLSKTRMNFLSAVAVIVLVAQK